MTIRVTLTNNELHIARYALEQQCIALRSESVRLLDKRMNGTGDALAKQFSLYIKDMENLLETLPEV